MNDYIIIYISIYLYILYTLYILYIVVIHSKLEKYIFLGAEVIFSSKPYLLPHRFWCITVSNSLTSYRKIHILWIFVKYFWSRTNAYSALPVGYFAIFWDENWASRSSHKQCYESQHSSTRRERDDTPTHTWVSFHPSGMAWEPSICPGFESLCWWRAGFNQQNTSKSLWFKSSWFDPNLIFPRLGVDN